MMMTDLYQRPNNKKLANKGQDDIVNSFYEERRARSGNQKYHNLLKKNISFFHPEHEPADRMGNQEENISKEQNMVNPKEKTWSHLPLPPLPHQLNSSNYVAQLPHSRIRSKSFSQPEIQPKSLLTSIPLSPAPANQLEDDYRQRLKQQLNKRININQYLTHISHQNQSYNQDKQNSYDATNIYRQIQTKMMNKTLKCQHRYGNVPNDSIFDESSYKAEDTARNQNDSRLSFMIGKDSRNSLEQSNVQRKSNSFEVTKNKTERIQSQGRQDSVKSLRNSQRSMSGHISHSSSKKKLSEEKYKNYLNHDELSELHENSHPIRSHLPPQPPSSSSYSLKYTYPQLQIDNTYKTRISQLEKQLEEMRESHKKETKLIQSIHKMRKVMLELPQNSQPCSLKQLWRWIKHLPRK